MTTFNASDYIYYDDTTDRYRTDFDALNQFTQACTAHNCEEHTIIVRKQQTNGVWIAQSVCQKCGARHAVKKTSIENFDSLPMFDSIENKLDSLYRQQAADRKHYFDRVATLAKQKNQQEKEYDNDQWWSKYKVYLRSDKWREKRERVLVRDNYQCQACRAAPATQVHHKTYKHVFDELLWELESICNDCHTRITAMDRRNKEPEQQTPQAADGHDIPF